MEDLPYSVHQETEDGYPVYVLEDRVARSQVWVAPTLGMNAYRFSLERDGRDLAVVDPPPTLAALAEDPSGFGIPILFPYPGRIRAGFFTFGGREFHPQPRAGLGAAHGFVLDRSWQIVAMGSSVHEGAVLAGRLESELYAELAGQWPSSFRLEVRYHLRAWTLTVQARAQNTGGEPLPLGYGLHPYLRAPLDHEETPGGCVISLPVTREWELSELMPTGRLLPLTEDLTGGVPLEGRSFDNVYTGVLMSEGVSRCVLGDSRNRLAVIVEADSDFRHWVLYTPPRPAVCFEPWTCVPDAVNLQQQGIETGLIVLAPGEARDWVVRLKVREV